MGMGGVSLATVIPAVVLVVVLLALDASSFVTTAPGAPSSPNGSRRILIRMASSAGSSAGSSAAAATSGKDISSGSPPPSPLRPMLLLDGREDKYEGILVGMTASSESGSDHLPPAHEFEARLEISLRAWALGGKRGVWLRIPKERSELIPIAMQPKFGFSFHHAEPSYLMLTAWLAPTPSKLPPNASHQVGVGAFVTNDRHQMLVVKERHGPLMGLDVWKMPTGLVDAGEDIGDAAEREVMEETGLSAKFRRILAMRHSHGFSFGKSDLFFITQLEFEEPEHQNVELVHQKCELEGCKWMDFEDYLAQEHLAASPLHCAINDVLARQLAAEAVEDNGVDGFVVDTGMVGNKFFSRIGGRESMLYR